MYSYFHDKFRLGELTGIEVAGEAKGTVIPPTDADGGAVQYSTMSFGQGMDLTMVQVCAAFGTIINGGTYHKPTVLAGKMSDDGATFMADSIKPARANVISRSSSSNVRQMIHEARSAFYAGQDKPRATTSVVKLVPRRPFVTAHTTTTKRSEPTWDLAEVVPRRQVMS